MLLEFSCNQSVTSVLLTWWPSVCLLWRSEADFSMWDLIPTRADYDGGGSGRLLLCVESDWSRSEPPSLSDPLVLAAAFLDCCNAKSLVGDQGLGTSSAKWAGWLSCVTTWEEVGDLWGSGVTGAGLS